MRDAAAVAGLLAVALIAVAFAWPRVPARWRAALGVVLAAGLTAALWLMGRRPPPPPPDPVADKRRRTAAALRLRAAELRSIGAERARLAQRDADELRAAADELRAADDDRPGKALHLLERVLDEEGDP